MEGGFQAPIQPPDLEEAPPVLVNMPPVVTFENENGNDDDKALINAINTLKGMDLFDPSDISFFFSQIEIKMASVGCKKQFTKFQVLASILPRKVQDEVKNILRKKEDEFVGNNSYKILKDKILEIFSPSQEAAFERAMGRTLVDTPSQLARALVNDLCDHELDGCCCHKIIVGIWKRSLPNAVKQAVADMPFNKANFNAIIKKADAVYVSTPNRPTGISVAAMQNSFPTPRGESVEETHNNAFNMGAAGDGGSVVDPEVLAAAQKIVAAVKAPFRGSPRGRGRGGYRGNRGGNRGSRGGSSGGGGGQPSTNRWSHLTRHSDNPPLSSCRKHYVWGKSAHWCEEPGTCPWKQFFTPKSTNQ